MKRIKLLLLLAAMLVLGAVAAHAGVKDWFTGIAIGKTSGIIIGGLFTVLSVFGVNAMKWKKATLEGKEFAVWVYKATRKDSPGGAKITGKEIEVGLKEAGDFGLAIFEAVGKVPGNGARRST